MLSQKKKLEIANICYANVSSDFAMMLNTKYQGSKFTWEGWVKRMQRESDLWLILNVVKGNTKANEALAREYTKEIAERLVELSGVNEMNKVEG